MTDPRPVVLCILDGFGIGDDPAVDAIAVDAIAAAEMPAWRDLLATWPHCRLAAAGEAVGLPPGQMGNSEVGHLNLGAGFRVLQDLPRIHHAITDGTFFTSPVLLAAVDDVRQKPDARLHLLGLVGPGGIHAHDDHLVAMAELAHRAGLAPDRVLLHAFTDGRDTPPHSAAELLPALEQRLAGKATLATVSGRFWAMDRDQRWERTERAYRAIVRGQGRTAKSGTVAVRDAYAAGVSDEFIEPTVVLPGTRIADGDAVIHLNFRPDRARQLTQALALPDFDAFDRGRRPAVTIATLTEYQPPADLPVAVVFPPTVVEGLAAHLSRLGLAQLHVAETEKYAHVTYFFNGGVEAPYPGEERILVPSRRDVTTYDRAPAMQAEAITDRVEEALAANRHRFVVVNYANPDMVGHTGNWDATLAALSVVDACLARLVAATLAAGGTLVITADHGNAERMRDEEGHPLTAHTTADVPLVLVGEAWRGSVLHDGELADVAPTLCELLGVPVPPSMTGHSLLGADPA